MRALLEHSDQIYRPLPSDLRSPCVRTSSRPYPSPQDRLLKIAISPDQTRLTNVEEVQNALATSVLQEVKVNTNIKSSTLPSRTFSLIFLILFLFCSTDNLNAFVRPVEPLRLHRPRPHGRATPGTQQRTSCRIRIWSLKWPFAYGGVEIMICFIDSMLQSYHHHPSSSICNVLTMIFKWQFITCASFFYTHNFLIETFFSSHYQILRLFCCHSPSCTICEWLSYPHTGKFVQKLHSVHIAKHIDILFIPTYNQLYTSTSRTAHLNDAAI